MQVEIDKLSTEELMRLSGETVDGAAKELGVTKGAVKRVFKYDAELEKSLRAYLLSVLA